MDGTSLAMTTSYATTWEPLGVEAAPKFAASAPGHDEDLGADDAKAPRRWYLADHDSRFVRYDVSPGESTTSDSDDGQDPFFPGEDDHLSGRQALLPEGPSIYPVSDRLDPFESLPLSLNRFQEHLITSHNHDTFAPGLDVGVRHPDMTSPPEPAINMITSAGFRITLARSALDRLSQGRYQGDSVRQSLELAASRYKSDAVATIQALSQITRQPHQNEELLEALIGVEKLEKKMGTSVVASTHLIQLREVLRSSGGPLNIQSVQLSRLMAHFECVYGTGKQSYVWTELDFLQSLASVNAFFASIWMVWRSLTQKFLLIANEMKNILGAGNRPIALPSFLKEGSTLRNCLSKMADGTPNLTEQDRLDLICQLTSLLMLSNLVVEQQASPVQLQQCMDDIHMLTESAPLGKTPHERVMWLLQNHHLDGHTRHVWFAAEHAWLLKHVSYNVQCMIKDWLLKFLTGQHLERCFKLDAFYFSYVS